jgi:hypothetical protein
MAKLQLLREEFIKERADGNVWFTTKEVLSEEQRLIRFVQCGQSQFTSFAESHDFQNNQLSDEQRKAVLHVLQSKDRVIAVRGGAGTGKTTMMKEAVAFFGQRPGLPTPKRLKCFCKALLCKNKSEDRSFGLTRLDCSASAN